MTKHVPADMTELRLPRHLVHPRPGGGVTLERPALFCEWVGTGAARWLGLPTFEIAIIDVNEEGLIEYSGGTKSWPGPAFVARAEDGTPWSGSEEELEAVVNPDVCAGLIVLDTWLLNCGRYRPEGHTVRCNTRNVFLSGEDAPKGKFKLVAMDHTHCFACGRELTSRIGQLDRIKDDRLYGHFPGFKKHVKEPAIRTYVERLAHCDNGIAGTFLAAAPAEWQPRPEVRTVLREFLSQRARFVAEKIERILADQGFLGPKLPLDHG